MDEFEKWRGFIAPVLIAVGSDHHLHDRSCWRLGQSGERGADLLLFVPAAWGAVFQSLPEW